MKHGKRLAWSHAKGAWREWTAGEGAAMREAQDMGPGRRALVVVVGMAALAVARACARRLDPEGEAAARAVPVGPGTPPPELIGRGVGQVRRACA